VSRTENQFRYVMDYEAQAIARALKVPTALVERKRETISSCNSQPALGDMMNPFGLGVEMKNPRCGIAPGI
jgi:hypothetical protein